MDGCRFYKILPQSLVKFASLKLFLLLFAYFGSLPVLAQSNNKRIHVNSQNMAHDKVAAPSSAQPVIGLVLSGGGARGAAHIGILKTLEELRVPVHIITGTSMGAIVGGLYASGYSVEELEKIISDLDWDEVFKDRSSRDLLNSRRKQDEQNLPVKFEIGLKTKGLTIPSGLIHGQKLNILLRSLTLGVPRHFDQMPIRFRAVAANIENGKEQVFDRGDLATIMRASMAIPGIFVPVEYDGQLYVDGGFANNLPVSLARKLGAQHLIVVDLSGDPRTRKELTTPLTIINQTLGFQIRRNTEKQLESMVSGDVLIQPKMNEFSSNEFSSSVNLIKFGEQASKLKQTALTKYSLSPEEYEKYRNSIRPERNRQPVIHRIVLDNQSRLDDKVIRAHLNVEQGKPLNLELLQNDIARLHGLAIFERVEYEVLRQNDQNTLLLRTKEKKLGPMYMRLGLNVESNFDGTISTNFTVAHTVNPIGGSGSEWRTELQYGSDKKLRTEFYQPLDKAMRYFIQPWINISRANFESSDLLDPSGLNVSENPAVDVSDLQPFSRSASASQLGLSMGRLFNTSGSLSFGVNYEFGDAEPRIGDLSAAGSDSRAGAWTVDITLDKLDSIDIPRSGMLAGINWTSTRKSLGAKSNQDSLRLTGLKAMNRGDNSLILWASLGAVLNSEAGYPAGYAIGGLFSLSGLKKYELSGRYAGMLRVLYMKRITDGQSSLNLPVYLGGSLESGGVWNDSNDLRDDDFQAAGSLFLAFDTPIGPLYIAHGRAEGDRSNSYLYLGRSFTFF